MGLDRFHGFWSAIKHDHIAGARHHLAQNFEMGFGFVATLEAVENVVLKIGLKADNTPGVGAIGVMHGLYW